MSDTIRIIETWEPRQVLHERVLTVKLPWAWWIRWGYKPVENRGWPPSFAGPLLIHAGSTKGKDWLAYYEESVREVRYVFPDLDVPSIGDCHLLSQRICARVQVVGHARTGLAESDEAWHAPGQIAWLLREPARVLSEPVRGQQGLWLYSGVIAVAAWNRRTADAAR